MGDEDARTDLERVGLFVDGPYGNNNKQLKLDKKQLIGFKYRIPLIDVHVNMQIRMSHFTGQILCVRKNMHLYFLGLQFQNMIDD